MRSIDLNENEKSILIAASNICAGIYSRGELGKKENVEKAIKHSVKVAIKMAAQIEKIRNLESDESIEDNEA